MARYNTVTSTTSTTGGTTITSPAQGLLTTFTGTAPYTVNVASPVLYTGISQSFYNNTNGTITIATPSGNIKGPGFVTSTSQTIPTQATYTLVSDGVDYVVINNEGGPQLSSSLTVGALTNGRVTYAGTNGLLQDSTNLQFNGTTMTVNALGVTNNTTVGGTLGVTGAASISSTTGSSSTSTGALVVGGGIGCGGNVYTGGSLVASSNGSFGGTMTVSSTAASSSYTSGALTVAGGVGINGALYVNSVLNCGNDITAWYSSDENLKTNITPIENALDKIDSIGGDMFDWNETALAMYPERTQRDIGLIAQKVKAVQPELVIKRDNGYLAVNYEKSVALLMQGVKDLRAEVNALKKKLGE